MQTITINDASLRTAAQKGLREFLECILHCIKDQMNETLDARTLQALNVQQTTLWAFSILQEEVMCGGFIQLIQNGYAPFFFQNPVAKIFKEWGIKDLAKIIYNARALYYKSEDVLTKDYSDEEFMALYEQFPQFDDLDDEFVEKEEEFVEQISHYVDEHITDFITIVS